MSPRHFVTVPESDEDIVEEVNYLQKTKQGMRTTTKKVPMTHPPQAKEEEASRSRSKGSRHAQVRRTDGPSQEAANVGDMDTHEFIDGYEDNIPDPIAEEMQPKVIVHLKIFHCHSVTDKV
jgi:hypothetical protein